MIPDKLRIGTRGSDMALAQTHLVRARLQAAWPELAEPGRLEIEVVTTIADKVLDRPLSAIGGKGLFTKELEQALLEGRIDLAVHSMKDVETWLPDGLEIACILPRDDPREAFLSHKAARLADLPAGSSIGTSSLRRAAQILEMRPDLRIAPLRGNANTRLRKLHDGECDATLLALCGLQRLGMAGLAQEIIATADMLPSVAQGALGIECRSADAAIIDLLAPLRCEPSTQRVAAERGLLEALDGSCRTPVAALARIESGRLSLTGLLFTPDGRRRWSAIGEGAPSDAHAIGFAAGQELRAAAGDLYTSLLQ
jgi:hydroxymethylbilane synthase